MKKETRQKMLPKAQTFCKIILFVGLGMCLLGLLLNTTDGVKLDFFVYSGIACSVLSIIIGIIFLRCPFCGKMMISGAAVAKYCPKCKRDFVTGERVKHEITYKKRSKKQ